MDSIIYLKKNLADHSLPVVTLSGSVSVAAPNSHFKRISREWILYVITQGTMKLQEEQKLYSLKAGDAVILSPGRCHFGIPVQDVVQYDYIHFWWNGLEECLLTEEACIAKRTEEYEHKLSTLSENEDPKEMLLAKKTTLLPDVFSEILEMFLKIQSGEQGVHLYQSYSRNAFLYMLLLMISHSDTKRIYAQKTNVFFVPELLSYLKNHLGDKLNSTMLEKEFHMNFDYMNRKFRESTGKPVFRYLQECRIRESKKLLQTSDFSISEIAEKLGYCNSFYFSKVFKSVENVTPSEYRKKYRFYHELADDFSKWEKMK